MIQLSYLHSGDHIQSGQSESGSLKVVDSIRLLHMVNYRTGRKNEAQVAWPNFGKQLDSVQSYKKRLGRILAHFLTHTLVQKGASARIDPESGFRGNEYTLPAAFQFLNLILGPEPAFISPTAGEP